MLIAFLLLPIACAAETPGRAGLPLVEVPASGEQSDLMAFVASGDGGWASLDKEIARILASEGIPVVGLNTRKLYWTMQTAETSGQALEETLRRYSAKWDKNRILIIGYSRGADDLPFMLSRLPDDLRERVALVVLIAPGLKTNFEYHYSDVFGISGADAIDVQPEVEKLVGMPILCMYGADEKESLCPRLPEGLADLHERPGGHHLDRDYAAMSRRILEALGR